MGVGVLAACCGVGESWGSGRPSRWVLWRLVWIFFFCPPAAPSPPNLSTVQARRAAPLPVSLLLEAIVPSESVYTGKSPFLASSWTIFCGRHAQHLHCFGARGPATGLDAAP